MASPSTLSSNRVDVDLDVVSFTRTSVERNWGDGLPCIPPTPELVLRYVEASGCPADEVVAKLPPLSAPCTIEKIAINAAMAGAPENSMPLLRAFVEAAADPNLNLAACNATTAPVTPIGIVNGSARDELSIPYARSALGGMASSSVAIGRATRLIMRNVAGQMPGVTSESVFGQPARVVGMITAEWEERSPWAPLSERRGVSGDAVTVFGTMGTANVVDTIAESGEEILELIGKSSGYIGANGYLPETLFSQVVIALNPIWADIVGRDVPEITEVSRRLYDYASAPIDWFPAVIRRDIEKTGRVQKDGRVHLVRSPEDIIVFVCGGPGSLHAAMLHGFTDSVAVTRPIGSTGKA
jgi:hypothetical protein